MRIDQNRINFLLFSSHLKALLETATSGKADSRALDQKHHCQLHHSLRPWSLSLSIFLIADVVFLTHTGCEVMFFIINLKNANIFFRPLDSFISLSGRCKSLILNKI
jgi:hypothetical protein